MGTSPEAQAHQLSDSQRSTIRRTVQDAIACHGAKWAMRHTCVELQENTDFRRTRSNTSCTVSCRRRLQAQARTAVIVCSLSLALKWQDEMRDKFGLQFVIVNSELMAQVRRSHGLHANPFQLYPRVIVSMA
jgi:hypothetical protein